MRLLGFILLAILLNVSGGSALWAQNSQPNPKIDLGEPPFLMFSYDEFNDLTEAQRKSYLKKLQAKLKKLPDFGKLTNDQFVETVTSPKSWSDLEMQVAVLCREKPKLTAVCSELEDLRIDSLNQNSNQKIENRHSDPSKQPSKKSK